MFYQFQFMFEIVLLFLFIVDPSTPRQHNVSTPSHHYFGVWTVSTLNALPSLCILNRESVITNAPPSLCSSLVRQLLPCLFVNTIHLLSENFASITHSSLRIINVRKLCLHPSATSVYLNRCNAAHLAVWLQLILNSIEKILRKKNLLPLFDPEYLPCKLKSTLTVRSIINAKAYKFYLQRNVSRVALFLLIWLHVF